MAHFEKSTSTLSKNASYSTHIFDRKQVWRILIPSGKQADIVLWGGDSLTVESPGGLLTFSESKPPGKHRRLFVFPKNITGFFELLAKHKNGSVWDRLRIVYVSKDSQGLRNQVINVLKSKAIGKMNFHIGSLQLTSSKMRGVVNLLQKGEIHVTYSPGGPAGVYDRKDDRIALPYKNASDLDKKSNMLHEMVHAAMDHYHPGTKVKAVLNEALAFVAQFIYIRIEKPSVKLKDVNTSLGKEAFKAAGTILAGKRITKLQQNRLQNAILAHPLYKNHKGAYHIRDGI